eukprot:4069157-Prymnesium_polylepis.1
MAAPIKLVRLTRRIGSACLGSATCSFFFVVVVVVPFLVFSLSSIFATILWAIECAEQNGESSGEGGGTESAAMEAANSEERRLSEASADMCAWYEWCAGHPCLAPAYAQRAPRPPRDVTPSRPKAHASCLHLRTRNAPAL